MKIVKPPEHAKPLVQMEEKPLHQQWANAVSGAFTNARVLDLVQPELVNFIMLSKAPDIESLILIPLSWKQQQWVMRTQLTCPTQ